MSKDKDGWLLAKPNWKEYLLYKFVGLYGYKIAHNKEEGSLYLLKLKKKNQ